MEATPRLAFLRRPQWLAITSGIFLLVAFYVYWVTGVARTMGDFEVQPFGLDVPVYAAFEGSPNHWLVTKGVRVYGRAANLLGTAHDPLVAKFPYAVMGVVNLMLFAICLNLLFGRWTWRWLPLGVGYAFSLTIWIFAQSPESYMLSILLTTGYIAAFLWFLRREATDRIALVMAAVYCLGLLNDITGLLLGVIPVVVYGLSSFQKPILRRAAFYHLAAVAIFVVIHFGNNTQAEYADLIQKYSPLFSDEARTGFNLLVPVMDFLFHSVGAPTPEPTFAALASVPNYHAYFSPSLAEYLSNWKSALFLICYLALLANAAGGLAVDRVRVALSIFFGLRISYAILFNPAESILYSGITVVVIFLLVAEGLKRMDDRIASGAAWLFAGTIILANSDMLWLH
jgi:hypothetical protein